MIIRIISKLVSSWRGMLCTVIGCALATPVYAEYYMVYDSEPCCTTRVEHHHYYHKAKPKKHKVHRVHKRVHRPCYRPTYKVEVFYPTYACEGGPCSPCSNCYPVWERVQCFEGHAGRVYTSQPSYYRDYGPPTFSYGPFYPYGYSQDQRTGDDTGAELQVNY